MQSFIDPLSEDDHRSAGEQLDELVRFVGYRPNALLTMARKPGLLNAVLGMVGVALRGDGVLAPQIRFLAACEASRLAGCFYSATHVVHAAHHLGIPWEKLAQLDRYLTSDSFTAEERAALAVASCGGTLPAEPAGEALAAAKQFFSEEQCLEIVAAVALFGWFNRWNSLLGSELEAEPAEALRHVPWLMRMNPAATRHEPAATPHVGAPTGWVPATAFSGIADSRQWVLPNVLSEMAARYPDREWVLDDAGGRLTFGDASSRAARAASWLASVGVMRDQRVGMFVSNGCEFIVAWLGLGKLAATAVMINTELRGEFLKHQLNDSGLTILIIDESLRPVLDEVIDAVPAIHTLIVIASDAVSVSRSSVRHGSREWATPADTAPARSVNLLDWADHRTMPEWRGEPPAASGIACIMYTSGTGGASKGVLMPHAHCALYGIGNIKCLQLTAEDRYYICLPLFHANGLLIQLGATLLIGMHAFVRRRFSASNWLSDIRAQRSTVSNMLGSIAAFVIAQPPSACDADHHLRALLNAPNHSDHDAIFRQRFGVRDVVSGFGMTEVNTPVWGRLGCPAPGAAGWTHDEHFEVCVADPETDLPVPSGQTGEILVRPKVPFGFMAGYVGAEAKTLQSWRNLWFHTGDAGTMNEQGLLTFIDRLKDCIRRRGENISAAEVEAVVQALPGIAEVAAYGVPSDIAGGEDEVMIALVAQPGVAIDCAMLVRDASARLPRFARPRYIRLIDRLPKTATGKIQRAVLRQQGAGGAFDAQTDSVAQKPDA